MKKMYARGRVKDKLLDNVARQIRVAAGRRVVLLYALLGCVFRPHLIFTFLSLPKALTN